MKILLTGSSSLLGCELLRQAPAEWHVTVTLHRNLELSLGSARWRSSIMDLTDREQVRTVVDQVRPDVVIHAASMGNLDACQNHPEQARQVNVEGTRHLLESSRPHSPLFIFTSSLYVFDGKNPPYDEEAQPNPINDYARMKLEAEKLVRELSGRPVILRPMTMYGWHSQGQRMNWVTWLLNRLRKGEPVKVVDDVYNNHLWIGDAARAITAVVAKGAQGIFHLGGPELASRYEFSKRVAEVFGLDGSLISPVSSDYFPNLAQRPPNTFCSIQKLKEVLGVKPLNLTEGLQSMKASEADWARALTLPSGLTGSRPDAFASA